MKKRHTPLRNISHSGKKLPSPAILFEDSDVLVIDKPAGLLSQGEQKGEPNLVDWLRGYLGRHYVGLIHRLDRNTSGIMLIAKRPAPARRLTEHLQSGEIRRTYLAWLVGTMNQAARWVHWLAKDEKKNQVSVVAKNHLQAKEAILFVRPVAKGSWNGQALTLASFDLETGRSHQIRVQAAAECFPLLGDSKYGKGNPDFGRPALHSSEIIFPHPVSGEMMKFSAPLPGDMGKIKQT